MFVLYLSAARHNVPHVSAMSSTRMATLPCADQSIPAPSHTCLDAANKHHAGHLVGDLRRSHTRGSSVHHVHLALLVDQRKIDLQMVRQRGHAARRHAPQHACTPHRLAPPASGDTMMDVFQSGMFSWMYLIMAGSANRLSTGLSKKP